MTRARFSAITGIFVASIMSMGLFTACTSAHSQPPGTIVWQENETDNVMLRSGTDATYKKLRAFPIGSSRLQDSVYVLHGRVVAFNGSTVLAKAPCMKPLFPPSSYALSPTGAVLACVDQRDYFKGRLVVVNLRDHKLRVGIGDYYINAQHALTFYDRNTLVLLKYDTACGFAGWEVYPTKLAFVSLETLRVLRSGPCATSVVGRAGHLAIDRKMESHWSYSLEPFVNWHPGRVQALLPDLSVLYLDPDHNLRHSDGGTLLANNVYDATWFER